MVDSNQSAAMTSRTASLSRREQQVLDALYGARQATVAEVVNRLDGEMSYSAVRSVLRVLVQKGRVRRRYSGPRYVYAPTTRSDQAMSAALRHLVRTFFGGSTEAAAVALLRMAEVELDEGGLKRLAEEIRRVELEGR